MDRRVRIARSDIKLSLTRLNHAGSSRLSSSCVSEILRHLAFFLVRHTSTLALSTSTTESGNTLAEKYLVFAKFLDGVCGDRVRPFLPIAT